MKRRNAISGLDPIQAGHRDKAWIRDTPRVYNGYHERAEKSVFSEEANPSDKHRSGKPIRRSDRGSKDPRGAVAEKT